MLGWWNGWGFERRFLSSKINSLIGDYHETENDI